MKRPRAYIEVGYASFDPWMLKFQECVALGHPTHFLVYHGYSYRDFGFVDVATNTWHVLPETRLREKRSAASNDWMEAYPYLEDKAEFFQFEGNLEACLSMSSNVRNVAPSLMSSRRCPTRTLPVPMR